MNKDFLFDLLNKKSFKIKSYVSENNFIDIGTPSRLQKTKKIIK